MSERRCRDKDGFPEMIGFQANAVASDPPFEALGLSEVER